MAVVMVKNCDIVGEMIISLILLQFRLRFFNYFGNGILTREDSCNMNLWSTLRGFAVARTEFVTNLIGDTNLCNVDWSSEEGTDHSAR